ncbi:P-loop containing nucleoside triphosphate hydrolase protein [Lasiosphaeris hirsuta]|uniref:P-loop containing nucleoside triphosphate hydrolase protein n=1 Tax=Lasiosphaeris hirsuta TaxID=260670 RepID=A0AA40E2R5_9PEZI|nr:P-loop containing nucleoside triphosphate hydrolase protein [Lasiosphaeris hirsuta]
MDYITGPKIEFYKRSDPVVPRRKPMKVLVVGLSRTGTASILVALQKLGLDAYHFHEANQNRDNAHWQFWLRAIRAKYDGIGRPLQGADDFDEVLWNYDAVTDAPCCLFVEELAAAYPDAKVVLSVRDRDSWFRSMQTSVLEIISWRSWTLLAYLDREYSGPYWALFNRATEVWSAGLPPYAPSARPALLRTFDNHNHLVRRVIPKENLLEFRPSDGWEPLCKFLDMPVPDRKFPHINDSNGFLRFHSTLYWSRWVFVLKKVLIAMGILGLLLVPGLHLVL